MEYLPCEELDSLTTRLKYALLRKNELIDANLSGRWMAAAEADLTRTNELLMNHSQTCAICSAQWAETSSPAPYEEPSLRMEEVVEEQYPPEDPEAPFRAPPRRMYRPIPTSILPFPIR